MSRSWVRATPGVESTREHMAIKYVDPHVRGGFFFFMDMHVSGAGGGTVVEYDEKTVRYFQRIRRQKQFCRSIYHVLIYVLIWPCTIHPST